MDVHATGSPIDEVAPLGAGDPREVGGYPLLGRIAAGGMGTVYLGRTPDDGGRVAVKTIHPNLAEHAAFRKRFRDEAVLAGRRSFCTARVLAHGEENGRPYIVSEYVGGVSLQHRIVQGGPLPDAEAHGVTVGVMSALAAIHAAGLVHRDLKPANVMLTLSGCRVIDFGIAPSLDALSPTGTLLGTPGWIAPELLNGGRATPASDIFTWGGLIAYAGTGRMPFGSDAPMDVALRTMRDEPDLDGLPKALRPAVLAALAKRPEDRPSASDLLLALVEQGELPAIVRDDGNTKTNPVIAPAEPDTKEGPDTAAFTVLGHVGARASTRNRVLGAATTALLIAGMIIALIGR